LSGIRRLFLEEQLLALQLLDLVFVCGDKGVAVRRHQAIHELVRLSLDKQDLLFRFSDVLVGETAQVLQETVDYVIWPFQPSELPSEVRPLRHTRKWRFHNSEAATPGDAGGVRPKS
jgi:hypothetical protein